MGDVEGGVGEGGEERECCGGGEEVELVRERLVGESESEGRAGGSGMSGLGVRGWAGRGGGRRRTVASSMKCGASGSRSSSSSSGWLGFGGGVSLGVGSSISREERARPRRGWVGMVPLWVFTVRVVLKPRE